MTSISQAGYDAAVGITFPFFSTPLTAESVGASLVAAAPPAELAPVTSSRELQPTPEWRFREVAAGEVYQVSTTSKCMWESVYMKKNFN